ncbi:MAG TPA: 3-carboxy-cis,cis-muconate cycloisomerase [Terriglobales bacterium]|nr:3-carboxy-cis,cis-muconate cycloisomerase [Terriglobales bacterium]
MRLLNALFRSHDAEQILTDESLLRRMLEVEGALASAQADLGLIPTSAAHSIQACCKVENLDIPALENSARFSGNLAIPLIKQLTAAVARSDSEAAKFVHLGATSQDIIDTAVALQTRDVISIILRHVEAACDSLRALTIKHRSTVMPARTWLQHAVPTTFGLKTAYALSALHECASKLRGSLKCASTLQFGGAAGTLAAFGSKGPRVAEMMAAKLTLQLPNHPWHSYRGRIAETATTLALLCGTLGKIAQDIALMTQTEISELSEASAAGTGVSSTMPQKHNPVASAAIIANCLRIPGLVSTILAAMMQEHERGLGGWHAEWETLPEILSLTAGAAERMSELLSGLEVHADRMRANLEITNGLIYAETLSISLAAKIGKTEALELVKRATEVSQHTGRHLKDTIREIPGLADHLSANDVEVLFCPDNYLGASQEFIDNILRQCATLEAANAVR